MPKGYEFAIEDEDPFGDLGIKKPATTEDSEALQKAIADVRNKNIDKKGSTALF